MNTLQDIISSCASEYNGLLGPTDTIDLTDCPTPDPVTTATCNTSTGLYLTASTGPGQFCYLRCPKPGPCTSTNSWTNAINDASLGLPNYFTWLNIHNSAPTTPGTIRQGFSQTTRSVNPYIASTAQDQYVVNSVYDSLYQANPLNPSQLIDWTSINTATLATVSYNGGITGPPAGTVLTYRFTLRPDPLFHDGRQVTAYDVAFSYLSMIGSGTFLASTAASCLTGITIVGPRQLDIGVNSCLLPLSKITNLPIVPGHYWSSQGASAWDSAVSACSSILCTNVQYTLSGNMPVCVGGCSSFSAALMTANNSQLVASYDPIASKTFVGSGPYQCGIVSGSGSGMCTTTGTENPGPSGAYTLTAYTSYTRSVVNLGLWIWAADGNPLGPDILTVTLIASCFNAPVNIAGPCGHWQQGIGNSAGNPVGIIQVSVVFQRYQLNWVNPFNWQLTPPQGIVPILPTDPTLYALQAFQGSTTLTPSPTGPNGTSCLTPNTFYDC